MEYFTLAETLGKVVWITPKDGSGEHMSYVLRVRDVLFKEGSMIGCASYFYRNHINGDIGVKKHGYFRFSFSLGDYCIKDMPPELDRCLRNILDKEDYQEVLGKTLNYDEVKGAGVQVKVEAVYGAKLKAAYQQKRKEELEKIFYTGGLAYQIREQSKECLQINKPEVSLKFL